MDLIGSIGHSIIDDLVEANGNWILKFMYNRFGYHVLLLLPNFCENDEEVEENTCLEELIDGIDEEIFIMCRFIVENPNTPFIISEYSLNSCIDTMKKRLESLIIDNNYDKFNDEFSKFKLFLKAVRNIEIIGTNAVFDAYNDGWQKYINKDI